MELTNVPREFSSRYLNDGFSGGEKKRLEILQLALQQPADRDPRRDRLGPRHRRAQRRRQRRQHRAPRTTTWASLIITHYQRILHLVQPERVSIMFDGRIVKEGGPELVDPARGRGLRLDPRRGRRGALHGRRRRHRRSRSSSPSWSGRGSSTSTRAATSQTPRVVIDAMDDLLRAPHANVHRGIYPLAVEATDAVRGRARADRRVHRLPRAARRSSRRTRPRRSTSSRYALGPRQRRRRRRDRRHARWSTTPTSSRGSCSRRRVGAELRWRADRRRRAGSTSTQLDATC